MTIFLLILKILGITLLVILGLLLLAVLCILFVPVRYRVTGRVDDSVTIRFRVSWLLSIVSFRGQYENKEFSKKLRIFGIPVRKKKEEEERYTASKPQKKKRKRSKKIPESEKRISVKPEDAAKPGDIYEPKNVAKPEDIYKPENMASSRDTVRQESDSHSVKEISEAREKKPQSEATEKKLQSESTDHRALEENSGRLRRLAEKIKRFFTTLKNLPGIIKSKLENLKEKAKNFRETAGRIKQEIQDENNRAAVKLLLSELKYLLKHISPGKVKADISFGMDDPATTGQVLGAVSMLPLLYRYRLQLYPDFETEQSYFKGSFDIKGQAQGIYVLIVGYHLIKDKNIRSLIQRYRNS